MEDIVGSVSRYFLSVLLDRHSRGQDGAKVSSVDVANRFGVDVADVNNAVSTINIKLEHIGLSQIFVYFARARTGPRQQKASDAWHTKHSGLVLEDLLMHKPEEDKLGKEIRYQIHDDYKNIVTWRI